MCVCVAVGVLRRSGIKLMHYCSLLAPCSFGAGSATERERESEGRETLPGGSYSMKMCEDDESFVVPENGA